ncbi:MAG TPA: hydrolase 1, exosortase A system-associated [Stellaceae bacterium]|nr:hydrolase 1, exosortase A system-associated [Stellaceae bacterium]
MTAPDLLHAGAERPLTFPCQGATLIGILHIPERPPSIGVVVVIGGPQYRIGSHRHYVKLGRHLAGAGIATFRFDCRGMGDSEGEAPGFENIDDDIRAAVDAMVAAAPSVKRVYLLGICDAAWAIGAYRDDPRIAGLVLLNPWVRSEGGEAQAYLKHYYLRRLMQRDFWQRVATGQVGRSSLRSLLGFLNRAIRPSAKAGDTNGTSLSDRLAAGLARFRGPILIVLSGRDLTAREFEDASTRSERWLRIFSDPRVDLHRLPDADHTLSREGAAEDFFATLSTWLVRHGETVSIG